MALGKEHNQNRSAVDRMPFCSNVWHERIAVTKERVFLFEI